MHKIIELSLDEDIRVNPHQPRQKIKNIDELADSIADIGLIEPIVVRKKEKYWELIVGERRWRAAKKAGLSVIPAIERVVNDNEARRIAFTENIQRNDLTPIEEVNAWLGHIDAEMWQHNEYKTQKEFKEENWLDGDNDKQGEKRAIWLLIKLKADKRNNTDYFTHKFMRKIESIFSQHPRKIDWYSFLNNDAPLSKIHENVRNIALEKELNKSQIIELNKISQKKDKESREVFKTGKVIVEDRHQFEEVPIEEASAREIKASASKNRLRSIIRDMDRVKGKREKTSPLPSDKYRVIYADPPWQYGDKLIDTYGAAEHHYKTMSIDELCNLPIRNLVAEEGVLFLWVTSPMLNECWSVIKAWGFEYKASFIWDKVKHNYGHYNSVRHEFLLICTKGSYLPETDKLYDSVQSIERTEKHSQKPEEFREIINKLYPHGKKLELFRRGGEIDGWDIWGEEAKS